MEVMKSPRAFSQTSIASTLLKAASLFGRQSLSKTPKTLQVLSEGGRVSPSNSYVNQPGKLCKQSGVVFENKLYLLGG